MEKKPYPGWRTNGAGGGLKEAVTVLAAFMVTLHVVPEAVSHPLQPPNVEPPAALAVSVTLVPLV